MMLRPPKPTGRPSDLVFLPFLVFLPLLASRGGGAPTALQDKA